ncbi:MAG TPA: tetratricopeptide repeat protein [Flavipsychrobacter sp.]|nr:tetratricopeptide repeat protein [Flavipsychrobacter sp.]
MKLFHRIILIVLGTLCYIPIAFSQEAQYSISTESSTQPQDRHDDFAERLYYDAVKAVMLDDDVQADSLFKIFIRVKPDEAAGYYELAKLSLQKKKENEAISYIKKAISLNDKNKWYKSLYADILANKEEYLEAAEIFNDLAKNEEYNQDYLLRAAMLYERSGKYKEALATLDKLIEESGPDEDYLLQKQQIYIKQDDVDNAVKVVQQLIEQNPREGKYYALLGEIYDNYKFPQKADDIYKKGLQMAADDPTLQLSLAEHYRKNNDTAKYNEYVKKAILNKNLDAESQLSLLLPYLQNIGVDSVRKKEGLIIGEQLATQNENDAQVQAVYGDILAMNNEPEKATEQYKRAIFIDPSKFPVWQQLLYSYTDKKDADSLIKYSEKALKLFPNQAIINYLHGIGEMNKNNYTEAIKAINRAIDAQPEDNPQLLAEMYSTLGDLYYTIKEYTLCDTNFNRALQLDPNNATILNNYSYYLSERGARLEEAEKMSKHSLEIRVDEPTFLDTYGWILYKMGKYDKAKEYIQKAIDANPQNADATVYEHLGDVYYKLNDKDKAVEYWKKAKEKGINDPRIDKKIQERTLYE